MIVEAGRAEGVNGHILAVPFSDSYMAAITEAVLNTGGGRLRQLHLIDTVALLLPTGTVCGCITNIPYSFCIQHNSSRCYI